VSRACSTYGREEEYIQGFGQKERDHMEDLGIDGRILNWIVEE
jgi:hypothetical protein